MGTYTFNGGSELIQPESAGLHTLYLMTPNNNYHRSGGSNTTVNINISGGYSDTESHHQYPGMVLLNSGTRSEEEGISGFQGGFFNIMGSKYLKAAQQLLDEVVNVGKLGGERREKEKAEGSGGGGESSEKREGYYHELSTAQRQELQMKKAKLVNMLDEVEQRYRQYHNQMQIVASSFEQAVGIGSAKLYTGLALQTISKQFRCLKDAISTQIKAAAKGLGEDLEHDHGVNVDGKPGQEESRLKYVDNQLRQQRALQQLGMMQSSQPHSAWRHQRGLPERAVSVLRAWLFEHFLHPYPKDSDKHMLAKQTGLTRSQVSNWFINARVRLWKPMVEEMYLEEIKQHDGETVMNGRNKTLDCINDGGPNKELGGRSKPISSQNDHRHQTTLATHVSINPSFPNHLEVAETLRNIPNLTPNVQATPKKSKPPENNTRNPNSIVGEERYSFIAGNNDNFGARFDHERLIVDASRRFHGNGTGVSLTLGLPHFHESLTRHKFSSDQGIMGTIQTSHYGGMSTASPPHSSRTTGYGDNITIDDRKRFVAPLLPNFVV